MSVSYSFESDVETIFEYLTDPDFLVERCVSLGEKDIECEVETDGRKTTVRIERTIKRDLPKVLAKLFGDENRMIMTEHWEEVGASMLGKYNVEVVGQPVTLTANFKLEPSESGSVYSVDYKCRAKIPMVGKKVEDFILGQTEDGMRKEMDFLQARLSA